MRSMYLKQNFEEINHEYAWLVSGFTNVKLIKIELYLHFKYFTMFTKNANKIFQDVIEKYHIINTVDQPFINPY